MQQRNRNKDCRVLFGDIFIVPSLGPALGYLTAMCRGGEIWLHLTGMICPWAGNLTFKFFKNVKSPPHARPPPPPPRRLYIDKCIIFFSLNITIARDSISGVTRFACTNMGSCSVSAYSIHVTVVGFGSAFVNI